MFAKIREVERKTCNKVPFNTDLLRWAHRNLSVGNPTQDRLVIAQIWCGMLVAFYYCLRISELLALTAEDIRVNTDDPIPPL